MEELRLKTMYGDVVVPCKLETNFMKVIDRIDESDAYKLFKGKVVFDTIIAGNPFPQEREINIGYAIYTDIYDQKVRDVLERGEAVGGDGRKYKFETPDNIFPIGNSICVRATCIETGHSDAYGLDFFV